MTFPSFAEYPLSVPPNDSPPPFPSPNLCFTELGKTAQGFELVQLVAFPQGKEKRERGRPGKKTPQCPRLFHSCLSLLFKKFMFSVKYCTIVGIKEIRWNKFFTFQPSKSSFPAFKAPLKTSGRSRRCTDLPLLTITTADSEFIRICAFFAQTYLSFKF